MQALIKFILTLKSPSQTIGPIILTQLLPKRSTEYASRCTLSNANARKAIDKIYYKMASRINASVIVELATPNTEQFIDLCNNEIKQIKALKAWRRSMRAGKKRREAEKRLKTEGLKD